MLPEPLAAQDLSLQLNFIQGERQRGDPVDVAIVVSNTSSEAIESYRVDFFASRDESLDDSDVRLGSFQSTERFRDNAFQENRVALDTCPLTPGDWRLFGRLEDVQPGDSDPGNDVARTSGTLKLTRDDADPDTCPQRDNPAHIINPGLNDAWFNPDTPGQGFFVNVFGESGEVFLAWFTFDADRPAPEAAAILGAAGHRWLTAFGVFEGTSATLEVSNTRGGRFDRGDPGPVNEPYGTVVLSFESCARGTVTYDLPEPGLTGGIPITRVVPDNVTLCEALAREVPSAPP
jgi:hypothetical protein